jgi:hypothetical protein
MEKINIAMKKRLSYVPAVIIVLIVVFLLSVGIVWLGEYISLPVWIAPIFLLVILVTVYEIMSRLGPEEFDSPSTQFLKLSGRDKVVLLITFLAIFLANIILSQLKVSFRSGWMNLLFLGLGLLAVRFIGSFFGSSELKKRNAKDRDQQES